MKKIAIAFGFSFGLALAAVPALGAESFEVSVVAGGTDWPNSGAQVADGGTDWPNSTDGGTDWPN